MKQTVKRFSLSFKNRVFFMCLLATLVPLLISSVVMVHIFTMSLNRQSEGTAKQQITEISERFSRLLEDCENTCAELTADGSAAWNLIDNTTIEIQKGMYLSLYQAVQEIYGHAQCSVYDAGGRLRFTTDTLPREGKLPVYWGLLRKTSQNEGMTYYRTDPYLAVTNPSILMQGAYSLENPHGARTGYVVLDFTRDNFDNVFSGFYSLTDTILILDDPFSALDKTTEVEVFEHLRQMVPDSIIFLISHRLYLFSETDGVIWMDNGKAEFSSHEKLLEENSAYRELYQLQTDYSVAKPTESAIERGIC